MAWKLHAINLIPNTQDWAIGGSEWFTIQGQAENPRSTTEAQLNEMLQSLLIDRFRLKFHFENREMPGDALLQNAGESACAAHCKSTTCRSWWGGLQPGASALAFD